MLLIQVALEFLWLLWGHTEYYLIIGIRDSNYGLKNYRMPYKKQLQDQYHWRNHATLQDVEPLVAFFILYFGL